MISRHKLRRQSRRTTSNALKLERLENRLLLANYDLFDTLLPSNLNPQTYTSEGVAVAIGSQYSVTGKPAADQSKGAAEVYDATTNEHVATILNPKSDTREFGRALAVRDSNVFVTDSDNLYVYEIDNNTATLVETVSNPSSTTGLFGMSLAMSGSKLAVGGTTTYVYDVSGANASLQATINKPTSDFNIATGFGGDVDIDGSTVVVSAFLQDVGVQDAGRAYVFDITDGTNLLTSIDNPTPEERDQFGRGVAISGNTIAVGAESDSTGSFRSGSVYLYDISTGDAVLRNTIVNPNPVENRANAFGRSLAIEGTTLLVSDYFADGLEDDEGSAYLYDIGGATPELMDSIENPTPELYGSFGFDVAILDSTIIVGAPGDDTPTRSAGGAYLYTIDNGSASLKGTLNNALPQIDDAFGQAVAVDGSIVVVGVPRDDTGAEASGAAYVFDVSGGSSLLLATLPNPTPAPGDSFGASVSVDGSIVVVGAPGADGLIDPDDERNEGTVYVFDVGGSSPVLIDTILNPRPQRNDSFGGSVAISGDNIVVGTTGDNVEGARDAGTVYLFNIGSGTATLEETIRNPSPADNDRFGSSVDVSDTTVVVAATRDDTGARDAGSVYVFDISGGDADLVDTISNPTPAEGDQFGSNVEVSGSHIVVSLAPCFCRPTPELETRAVSVYEINAGGVSLLATLTNPLSADAIDEFGSSVAISGSKVVVGSMQLRGGTAATDVALVYDILGGNVVHESTIPNPTPEPDDRFGHSVAISGGTLVVGAPRDDTKRPDQGAAYVYKSDAPTPDPPAEPGNPPGNPPVEPGDGNGMPGTDEPPPNLEVFYQNKERNAQSDVIEAKVELYNRDSESTNFKDVVLRYKLDPDNLSPVVSVTSTNAPGGVEATFVDQGADSYVDFRVLGDFTVKPDKRLKLRFEIENEEGLPFDQTNDMSFVAAQTSLAPTNSIEVNPAGTEVVSPQPDPDPDSALAANVEVFYQNKARRPETDEIEAKLELYNRDSETKNFKGLEFRYRFDPDGLTPQLEINSTNATGRLESTIVENGAESYVSFRVVDDFFVKSNKRLKVKFEITNVEGSLFNQANDLSFVVSQRSLAPTDSIEVDWSDD